MATKKNKKTSKKTSLPPVAAKSLQPFIEKGIANGIFKDDSTVVEMFKKKAQDPSLADTISTLGGIKSETAQSFVADIVRVDLSSILRQKRYTAHLDVWEVAHRTVGAASGNPRPVCFVMGQAVIEDGGSELEPALFKLGLWDEDAALGDDIESGGRYSAPVTCRNLDDEILNLNALSGLTSFSPEDYDHTDAADLLRETYEVTPIADLADDLSKGRDDYRLVEATVSYSGIQTSRAGNPFGKIALKDDSIMTMEAIESGENLVLNGICSTDIATRYGKYSRVLALITTKQDSYGLSANVEAVIGLVVIEPPKAETKAPETKEDDASSYFSGNLVSLDDDEDEAEDEAEDEEDDSEDDAEDDAEEEAGEWVEDEDEEEDESEDEDADEADEDEDEWGEWE